MTLPAFAAERHHRLQHGARSYRSISPADAGAQQQTHRLTLLLSIDGTDGRTDATLVHRPCSSCCAGSVTARKCQLTFADWVGCVIVLVVVSWQLI